MSAKQPSPSGLPSGVRLTTESIPVSTGCSAVATGSGVDGGSVVASRSGSGVAVGGLLGLRRRGRRRRFRLSRVEHGDFDGLPGLDRHGLIGRQLSILAGAGLDDRVVAGGQIRDVQAAIVALVADVGQRLCKGLGFALEGEAGPADALAILVLDEDDERAGLLFLLLRRGPWRKMTSASSPATISTSCRAGSAGSVSAGGVDSTTAIGPGVTPCTVTSPSPSSSQNGPNAWPPGGISTV